MKLIGKNTDISNNNFGIRVRKRQLLIDKTLMIQEFLLDEEACLITRPRGFGKTLNMSMLHHFFSATVNGLPTAGLFNEFAIAQVDQGALLRTHQGQYPVLFISFNEVVPSSFDDPMECIRILIGDLFQEHSYLLDSDKIDNREKKKIQAYCSGETDIPSLSHALYFLSRCLYQVYKKRSIILIDAYDTPLISFYDHPELNEFMWNLYATSMKGNPYLEKSLMMGIFRIGDDKIIPRLNNLNIHTVLDSSYNSFFGFTEEEVIELMDHVKVSDPIDEIRHFYSGYRQGGTTVYNPLSMMNYLKNGLLESYADLAPEPLVLKDLLLNNAIHVKEQMFYLITRNTAKVEVFFNFSSDELINQKYGGTFWTLFLFLGYLTVEKATLEGIQFYYDLKIPNQEIFKQYTEIFTGWLAESMESASRNQFNRSHRNFDNNHF